MEEKVTIEKTGWWKSFLKSEFFYHYKHNIPAIIGSILVVVAILVAVSFFPWHLHNTSRIFSGK